MLEIKVEETEAPYRTILVRPADDKLEIPHLGLKEFHEYYVEGKEVPLRMGNVHVSGLGDELANTKGDFTFNARRNECMEHAALVDGGWLPLVFAQSEILLPDSNIAGNLGSLKKALDVPLSKVNYGLDLGGKYINPILAATEGNKKRFPSLREIESRMLELCQKLDNRFPNRVLAPSSSQILAAYSIQQDYVRAWPGLKEFMRESWHLLLPKNKTKSSVERFNELEKIRKTCGIKASSLAYLLFVDCVFSEKQAVKNSYPSKELIKPHLPPTDENLYNVCSDLWIIEMSCLLLSNPEELPGVICSNDRGLIGSWTLLAPTNFSRKDQTLKASLSLSKGFAKAMPEPIRVLLIDLTNQD